MDDWQVLRENVSNFMPDILNARALARQREEWEKDRAEIARQRAEEEQMRQGWMRQANPQFNTVYTPEQRVQQSNPNFMSPGEAWPVIDQAAEQNVRNQLVKQTPSAADFYHNTNALLPPKEGSPEYNKLLMDERQKIYNEQLSGSSTLNPTITQTIPASTRQEQVPFVPQNYGEAMAQQAFQQKKMEQFMGTVSKPLDFASATGNNKLKEWVASKAEESDIPEIKAFGQLMKKIDFTAPQTMVIEGATINGMTPEQKKMFGVNPERVYHDNDVATFTKNQDGSVIQTDFKPGKQVKSKLAKGDAFPNTPEGVEMARKKLGLSPDEVAQAKLYNKDKNMLSIEYSANEDDTYSLKPVEKAPKPAGAGAGAGTGGPGVGGKFTDDEYARFYNMGQKTDGLPQRVRGTARVNQQARADWDAGYRDWLSRNNKSGSQAGLEAGEQRSDIKALEKLKIQKNAIGGFEKGAKNAMSIASELEAKIKRGSIPKINSWSMAVKYHLGDPEIRPFYNSVVTAMTEYMKVVTAGTNISSTELSVAAQERAKELLSTSDNHKTFKKQMDVFDKEMKGKMKGIEDQRRILLKEMDRAGKGGTVKPPKTKDDLLKFYMKHNPKAKKEEIEASEAYLNDVKRFGL